MKYIYCLILSLATTALISTNLEAAPHDVGTISIIPQPVKLEKLNGYFLLNNKTKFISAIENREIAILFAKMLKSPTGYTLEHTSSGTSGIQLVLNSQENSLLGKEGYNL